MAWKSAAAVAVALVWGVGCQGVHQHHANRPVVPPAGGASFSEAGLPVTTAALTRGNATLGAAVRRAGFEPRFETSVFEPMRFVHVRRGTNDIAVHEQLLVDDQGQPADNPFAVLPLLPGDAVTVFDWEQTDLSRGSRAYQPDPPRSTAPDDLIPWVVRHATALDGNLKGKTAAEVQTWEADVRALTGSAQFVKSPRHSTTAPRCRSANSYKRDSLAT